MTRRPKADRVAPITGLPPAVVLDIDETVLDNSPYQARLIRDGKAYDDASWAAWCKEERARALPGAVAFTQFAAAHGIAVRVCHVRWRDGEMPSRGAPDEPTVDTSGGGTA